METSHTSDQDLSATEITQIYGQGITANLHRDIVVTEFADIGISELDVFETVFNPAVSYAGKFMARHLSDVKKLFVGKHVLDLGAGSGILGITAGLLGALTVTFTDINPRAVENSLRNAQRYGLSAFGVVSDGYEALDDKKYEVIIANIPGAGGQPLNFVEASFVGAPDLARRIIEETKVHLAPGGTLVMPSSSHKVASRRPDALGSQFGFEVERLTYLDNGNGTIQEIYGLTIKPE